MSIKAMLAVFEHSRSEKGARLVLLAIADHAHADGDCGDTPPAVKTLAAKARLSERAVQYAFRELEKLGELVVVNGTGKRGTNRYRIVLPGLDGGANSAQVDSSGGANRRAKGVQPTAPEPKEEPRSSSADADRDLAKKHTYVMQNTLRAGEKYPKATTGHLARLVKQHLAEGFSANQVLLAARKAMERGSPGLIPNILAERAGVNDGPPKPNEQSNGKLQAWVARGCQHEQPWCDRENAICDRCRPERARIIGGAT